jgi:hypothetical protein
MTIRKAEHGETVSYFHLYVSMKNRASVLKECVAAVSSSPRSAPTRTFAIRKAAVIKLSEERTIVS